MRAERIARLLPEVYQRTIVPGTPIATLIDVMSELHAPVEDVLAHLPDYFDPQLTPDRFVPFLARWVDLSRWLDDSGGFDSGVGRLRQVVAAAAQLSRLRGTAQGLRDALEWATGVAGVRIDEEVTDAAGRARPFHVVVTLPAAAAVHRALVTRIVQQEKPAHVTAEIVFEDGPAAPPAPAPEPEAAPAPPPTLPVGAPAAPTEPSFPGSEPAPVITGVPEPEAGADAGEPGSGQPTSSSPGPLPTVPAPPTAAAPSPVTPAPPSPAAAHPPTPSPSSAPSPPPAPSAPAPPSSDAPEESPA